MDRMLQSRKWHVRRASEADLDAIKALCDGHKVELGFVMRPALAQALRNDEMLVVVDDSEGDLLGFVHYHHRRDAQTTLYHIAVQASCRGSGVGRALVVALCDEARSYRKAHILLKCPEGLPANHFYQKCGFVLDSVDPGKSRRLNVWRFVLL